MLIANKKNDILEYMDEDEYAELQDQRRGDNFIVGGDDGYKDYGGEIWEYDDEDDYSGSKKKNGKNGNKSLQNFFFKIWIQKNLIRWEKRINI